MARQDKAHSRGRMETLLVRAPLWESDGAPPDPAPYVGHSLLGAFSCSRRLGLVDFKVLAFVLERFAWQRPPDPLATAAFTLYELGHCLYDRDPGGRDCTELRAALARLYQIEITLEGYDAFAGKADPERETTTRLVTEIVSELDRLRDEPSVVVRKLASAGLRGHTFKVRLAPWLAQQVLAGYVTYLDFAVMRRLSGLAERLWVYLQAERYKNDGTWVAFGPRIFHVLGMNYARPRDARRALARAATRIKAADPRYESIEVVPRFGGWGLRVNRVPSAERRAVRSQIRGSLGAE